VYLLALWSLAVFELFGTVMDETTVVKVVLNYLFRNAKTPGGSHLPRLSPDDLSYRGQVSPRSGAPSEHRSQAAAEDDEFSVSIDRIGIGGADCERAFQTSNDPRDVDDGLPPGSLAGAILKMWGAQRLD
jgi:hypothetical protein